jgi:DNA-directed RNA polymerase specialized sigma24 family protein
MAKAKEIKEYYVNPKDFKKALNKYYKSDKMTDELAVYILKIANGLSYRGSFINYPFKDDMVGDALIKMYAALKNKKYSFDKNSNPFSYFNTIAWNAFINRIKREKRQLKAEHDYRQKVYEDTMTDPDLSSGTIYVKPEANDPYEVSDD